MKTGGVRQGQICERICNGSSGMGEWIALTAEIAEAVFHEFFNVLLILKLLFFGTVSSVSNRLISK